MGEICAAGNDPAARWCGVGWTLSGYRPTPDAWPTCDSDAGVMPEPVWPCMGGALPWLTGVCACCTADAPYCDGLAAGTEGLAVDIDYPRRVQSVLEWDLQEMKHNGLCTLDASTSNWAHLLREDPKIRRQAPLDVVELCQDADAGCRHPLLRAVCVRALSPTAHQIGCVAATHRLPALHISAERTRDTTVENYLVMLV